MNYDKLHNSIHCHGCNKDLDADMEVILTDIEGSDRKNIECLNCFAHLGYDDDWKGKW